MSQKLPQDTPDKVRELGYINRFYKGFLFQADMVVVSFNIVLPRYMNFVSLEFCNYNGWSFAIHHHHHHMPRKVLHVSKRVDAKLALSICIHQRAQIQEAIKLFNPHPRKKRKKGVVKVAKTLWIQQLEKELLEEEDKNEPL